MIAFVHGTAVDMTENSVIVEAGGIGYDIYMTGTDLSNIHMGEEVKIHTYFSVREDAMKLYGFRSKDDLSKEISVTETVVFSVTVISEYVTAFPSAEDTVK